MNYSIAIPGYHPPLLNSLLSAGKYYRSRRKRECAQMVAAYATIARVPTANGQRGVHLRLEGWGRGGRTCDPDAPWKAILDALVAAKLLVDDSPRYCVMGRTEIVRARAKLTVITLEERLELP